MGKFFMVRRRLKPILAGVQMKINPEFGGLDLAGTANSKAQKPGKSTGGYAVVSCQMRLV